MLKKYIGSYKVENDDLIKHASNLKVELRNWPEAIIDFQLLAHKIYVHMEDIYYNS